MSRKNIRRIAIVLFIAVFLIVMYFCIGQPMVAFVQDHESFQEYMASRGVCGWVLFILLVAIQNFSTCIPGAPFNIAAGLALGAFKGALICDLGATIGNSAAFLLGRKFGPGLIYSIFPKEKVKKVEDQIIGKNPVLIHVLFMLLPLPKDTYAWLGYYSKENLPTWILITFICRFPHIFVYTLGGAMIMEKNYAVIIGGATFAVLVYIVVFVYLRKKKRADTT